MPRLAALAAAMVCLACAGAARAQRGQSLPLALDTIAAAKQMDGAKHG